MRHEALLLFPAARADPLSAVNDDDRIRNGGGGRRCRAGHPMRPQPAFLQVAAAATARLPLATHSAWRQSSPVDHPGGLAQAVRRRASLTTGSFISFGLWPTSSRTVASSASSARRIELFSSSTYTAATMTLKSPSRMQAA